MSIIKKISELEQVTALSDTCNILIEEKGRAKRIAAAQLGMSSVSDRYDLKEGYGYTENMTIGPNGEETPLAGYHCKLVDYIPVKAGISYTMYGVGYALYDENKIFLSGLFVHGEPFNAMYEFTPTVDGFVRLTINSIELTHARFCQTSDKDKEPVDYMDARSPFVDWRIPCDVHLYGDSNSEGYGLDDPSKAWSNRLGALITGMPQKMPIYKFNCFASSSAADYASAYSAYPALGENGYAKLSAYTDNFEVCAMFVGEIKVKVDAEEVGTIRSDDPTSVDPAIFSYVTPMGYHTIELFGVSGENIVGYIMVNKTRTFTNHAVYGSYSTSLPKTPDGNIVIVMYGTNDRNYPMGYTDFIFNFNEACKKAGAVTYIFTPIPTAIEGESADSFKQSISDIIAQLPTDCINIYKDLQLIALLSADTIFSDSLHLNEKGHKLLYAIAASKLQLAALTSELVDE